MKSTKSIWLEEYEGLLPLPASDCAPSCGVDRKSRVAPGHDPVGPHFELIPMDPTKTAPAAPFE